MRACWTRSEALGADDGADDADGAAELVDAVATTAGETGALGIAGAAVCMVVSFAAVCFTAALPSLE